MANEKVNKVVLGNETLIDLTSDTVSANNLLAGATAHDASGSSISGSMPNQGTKTASLNAGQSYTIPQGYHSGSGVVTANSLASQTVGTATANDIASGLTAWVNGTKLTGTATAGGATITVTYNSSFYNKTMTCSNGTKTYTKTTTSSGSTEFKVSDEGTWTITCNGVSRTVYVTLNYSTQMAVTKTVTMYGAAGATISYTDSVGSKIVTLDNTGKKTNVSITFIPPSQSIVFTDTNKAKNPDNLSQNYSKSIAITESTSNVYVMPDNALYWWGYNNSVSSAGVVGHSETPSFNTADITLAGTGNNITAFLTDNKMSGTKAHLVGQSSGNVFDFLYATARTGLNPSNLANISHTEALTKNNVLTHNVITYTFSSVYIGAWSRSTGKVYALWYE